MEGWMEGETHQLSGSELSPAGGGVDSFIVREVGAGWGMEVVSLMENDKCSS